jgi:membrane peptidoglycan carboxypeptidase
MPVPAGPSPGGVGQDQGGLGWVAPGILRRGEVRPRRRLSRRIRRFLGIVMALGVLGALVFAGLLMITPAVSNAPALAQALARAHRAAYPGPPVPQPVAAALVATEDHRFYSEPGIDPIAVARVIAGRLTGGPDQGDSTLYQQLAKTLYTPGRTGVLAETEQVLLGIKLAFSYPKAEILQMYADVTYFGHGYYGLAAASCGYFGKGPAHLSWGQAAMLAGLVQAPSADDPKSHFASARAREAHVLGRLAATGWLTQAQATRAYRQPLHLAGGRAAGCAASRPLPGT